MEPIQGLGFVEHRGNGLVEMAAALHPMDLSGQHDHTGGWLDGQKSFRHVQARSIGEEQIEDQNSGPAGLGDPHSFLHRCRRLNQGQAGDLLSEALSQQLRKNHLIFNDQATVRAAIRQRSNQVSIYILA
jgi:hypothetical protein